MPDFPIDGSKIVNKAVDDDNTDLGHLDGDVEAQLVRIVLQYAGYDVSKIRDYKNLDKEAQDVFNAKTTRKRLVFSSWPRDPNGKPITPDSSLHGKTTSNGIQFWGATLHDFYYVRRLPYLGNLLTISSGSKLAAWMKANGELDWAAPEIAWAEAEENPREVPPCDIARLVEDIDFRLSVRIQGQSMPPAMDTPIMEEAVENSKGKGKEKEKMPSVFDASAYPAPWPLVPFSYPAPIMQKYIPLHLLPKKLIVHDPWGVLSVPYSTNYDGYGWTKKPDVTHVYRLRLSEAKARLQADVDKSAKERAEIQEKFGPNDALVDGCIISSPGETVCHVEPFIIPVYPPVPQSEPVEEAHLYLSPVYLAGLGNHSVVYTAEWEIPRSMLMPPSLCQECVREDVVAIVNEQDGEDGSRMDPKWKEKSAVLKKVKVVQEPLKAGVIKMSYITSPQSKKNGDSVSEYYTLCPEGPVRPIATRIPWRSADEPYSTACSHTYIRNPYPSTTKVRVIAKLSIAGDVHLNAEADNYQKFPTHFFEHWNGYNVVPPLHDPTPVGAVVPQFYGFYEPEEEHGKYLSPIMLLEDCGVPVDPEELSIDDKNECASLYYRFHDAGWSHGSVAARNILVQRGPLSVWPAFRSIVEIKEGNEWSFRLIDFGRSQGNGDRREAAMEETSVGHLFRHMSPWDHLAH